MMDKEEYLAATVAHELAHYYRVDQTKADGQSYFYRRDAQAASGERKEEPGLAARGADLDLATRDVVDFLPDRNWVLHSGLAPYNLQTLLLALKLGTKLLAGESGGATCGVDCISHCQRMVKMISDDLKLVFYDLLSREATEAEKSDLTLLLPETVACMSGITLKSSEDNETQGIVLDAPQGDSLVSRAMRDLSLPKSAHVYLGELGLLMEERVLKGFSQLEQAERDGIGFYTEEQKADEVAMEWLQMLGMDPEIVVERQLSAHRFLDSTGQLIPGLDFTYEECRSAFENAWSPEPPVVFFSDAYPHHGSCFRAFNASQEIAAHRYADQEPWRRVPMPASPSWDEIRARASAITRYVESKVASSSGR